MHAVYYMNNVVEVGLEHGSIHLFECKEAADEFIFNKLVEFKYIYQDVGDYGFDEFDADGTRCDDPDEAVELIRYSFGPHDVFESFPVIDHRTRSTDEVEPLRSEIRREWKGLSAILAVIVFSWIVSGIPTEAKVELDYGGGMAIVERSWWGLVERRWNLGLLKHSDMRNGAPYRPLKVPSDYQWCIQVADGDWLPYQIFDVDIYSGEPYSGEPGQW